MYIKIIAKAVAMILLLAFQVSFVSALPGWMSSLNAVLVVLLLILAFISFKSALLWAMVVGLLWDLYSFTVFGVYAFSLIFCLLVADFLLENFFTNRSLYSFLALALVATVVFELFLYTSSFFISLLAGKTFGLDIGMAFFKGELYKVLSNLGFTFIMFYMINFFSKRFKPMFLIR